MALKRNLKKQCSIYQLCSLAITSQLCPSPSLKKSNNTSQGKSSRFASFSPSPSLKMPSVNMKLGMKASLVDNKLTQILVLHTR